MRWHFAYCWLDRSEVTCGPLKCCSLQLLSLSLRQLLYVCASKLIVLHMSYCLIWWRKAINSKCYIRRLNNGFLCYSQLKRGKYISSMIIWYSFNIIGTNQNGWATDSTHYDIVNINLVYVLFFLYMDFYSMMFLLLLKTLNVL